MIRTTALSLLLLAGTAFTPAPAAAVRDTAGMFSGGATRQAGATLDRIEREQQVPVLIETIESLRNATTPEDQERWKREKGSRVIELLAERRFRESGNRGVYILLSRSDHLISNVLVNDTLGRRLDASRRKSIRDAFIGPFRRNQFDEGLLAGVTTIERALASAPSATAAPPGGNSSPLPGPGTAAPPRRRSAPVPVPAPAPGPGPNPGPRPQGLGIPPLFLMLGLVFLLMFGMRILRGLMGGGARYAGSDLGGGGGKPGFGPGYPGGFGGRGGGFWSGMFGGLAGSVLGNWGYDRWARGHSPADYTGHGESYGPASHPFGPSDPGGFVGGDDNGGQGASWDGGGGGSPGDWLGGGDSGGGADWGGGGGDWGGGGGGGDW